jgi:hypothetical protein
VTALDIALDTLRQIATSGSSRAARGAPDTSEEDQVRSDCATLARTALKRIDALVDARPFSMVENLILCQAPKRHRFAILASMGPTSHPQLLGSFAAKGALIAAWNRAWGAAPLCACARRPAGGWEIVSDQMPEMPSPFADPAAPPIPARRRPRRQRA